MKSWVLFSVLLSFTLLTKTHIHAYDAFHPMPTLTYYNDYATMSTKSGSRGIHPALRFFIISIGTFPLAYLLTYPIISLSTNNSWSMNRQITTTLAISAGLSVTVSLIDLIRGFTNRKKNEYIHEAI
ncbi:hypothetical protein PVA45_00005 [Entomospira entomophila]|uniref:Uncharacterized protein n=1 Tax=Entomospira entomophila TaxID=2719988 RepID=A0A968G8G2_9SPIO|nr:hypothetical protein [Entomospira entomophilus]NIZ39906.1 hypothetical protein [Entomospira entomophilus]WDI35468.1 hypothetical protein PVA45_00005 [Entomospira entomophilus]